MKIIAALILLFACFGNHSPNAQAQSFLELSGLSPDTHYQTFDTEHFHFIFQDGYQAFTEKAALHYEHAHEVLSPILKWQPRNRTTVLIADNDDAANGFTLPSLRVGMVLIATPPESWFSTSYTEDWIKLLVFHEYTHFLNIDPTTEWMEGLRIVFGDVIRPNGLWPTWMLEGLAVYFETRTSKLGRGRSPYYDGILRAYLNEGRLDTDSKNSITLDRVNGEYPYFPAGEIPYLFGYHLWNKLSQDHTLHHDTDQAMGELSLRSSSRFPYLIEGNLENVMNKNWRDYWSAFVRDSRARLGGQIEAVKKTGVSKVESIAKSDFSAFGGTISPNGEWLAYNETSMKDRSRLILLNLKTKEKRRLDEKLLGVGLAFTPDSRFLIYSALTRSQSFQLYSELFSYDLASGQTQQFTEGARAKDPCISPDGKKIAYIRSSLGSHELILADLKTDHDQISIQNSALAFQPKAFSILGSPHFLNSDELIFSDQELGSTQSDLKKVSTSSRSVTLLLRDGFINRYPTSHQGKIFFVSNQSGIENIHVLDQNKSVRISNVITGAAFPFFSPEGNLYANLLSADGYQIVALTPETASSSTPLAAPDAPAPLPQALDHKELKIDPNAIQAYSPISSLAPRQWAPLAFINFDHQSDLSIGGFILGFDATGKHQYSLLGSYNSLPKTFDFGFNYTLYAFRPVIDLALGSSTTHIASDAAHEQYRKSSTAALKFSYPVLWVRSSLRPSFYIFNKSNEVLRLSDSSRVTVGDFQYSNASVPGFGLNLNFSDARRSKLGFMSEMGNDLKLQAENRINTSGKSLAQYLLSWSHYFSLGDNSVIQSQVRWMGTSRIADSSLTTSTLSGKSTSNVFDRGMGITLSEMNIRGYSDFSATIRSIGSGSIDYHFPIFRHFTGWGGTTPAFFKQTHGFVFAETALIPRRTLPNLFLPSLGAGISTDMNLLIHAPIRFNLEYQNGTRKDYGGTSILFLSIESDALF